MIQLLFLLILLVAIVIVVVESESRYIVAATLGVMLLSDILGLTDLFLMLLGVVLLLALMVETLPHDIRELLIREIEAPAEERATFSKEENKFQRRMEISRDNFITTKSKPNPARNSIPAFPKPPQRIMELKQPFDLIYQGKTLKSNLDSKSKDVDVAEVSVIAMGKQFEGFHRLDEENQNLHKQLQFSNYNSETGDCRTLFLKSTCRKRNQCKVNQGGARSYLLTNDLEFEQCERKKSSLGNSYPLQEGLQSGWTSKKNM